MPTHPTTILCLGAPSRIHMLTALVTDSCLRHWESLEGAFRGALWPACLSHLPWKSYAMMLKMSRYLANGGEMRLSICYKVDWQGCFIQVNNVVFLVLELQCIIIHIDSRIHQAVEAEVMCFKIVSLLKSDFNSRSHIAIHKYCPEDALTCWRHVLIYIR